MEEYCIIASERRRRPSDFAARPDPPASGKLCPFCAGNEEMTPPATAAYTEDGIYSDSLDGKERVRGWQVRCVPNMYPAASQDPGTPIREWTAFPARGYHEVIIEVPDHEKSPAKFESSDLAKMTAVYRDRYARYIRSGCRYVSIFKNWGRGAGASLSHTHTQLIALPIVPPLLAQETLAINAAAACPYCMVAEREASSERLISGNRNWIHFAPFFSRSPYETWIMPKRHVSSLLDLDSGVLRDLAAILGEAMKRLYGLLEDPPYNYMIYQLEDQRRSYHMNIRIQPVISKIAGFEKNTGIYINPVSPEQAASEMRSSL